MGLPECATLPETPRKKQSKSEARLRDEARKPRAGGRILPPTPRSYRSSWAASRPLIGTRVLRELPAKSVILDGEIVASDAAGMPDFWRLFLRSAKPAQLYVWAFDLLALNRKDLRKWSLEARQRRLRTL